MHVLDHAASGLQALLGAFLCDRIALNANRRPVRRAVTSLDMRHVLLPVGAPADPVVGQLLPQPPRSILLERPIGEHLHHRLKRARHVEAEQRHERNLGDGLDGHLRYDDRQPVVTRPDLLLGDLEKFVAKSRVVWLTGHRLTICNPTGALAPGDRPRCSRCRACAARRRVPAGTQPSESEVI